MDRSTLDLSMVQEKDALPGRDVPITRPGLHRVWERPLDASPPAGFEEVWLGMGCFWGAERLFWQQPGVWLTAVGYAGGYTPNPTYREVCSGRTGHAEVVRVVHDPQKQSLERLLKIFWEAHDPTQGMRQGNDVGTQYRSAIYWTTSPQEVVVRQSHAAYLEALRSSGWGAVTTELAPAKAFYHAEPEHQQYLAANPLGYCGLAGTGVACPAVR